MAKTLLEEEDAYRLLRNAGVPVPASAVAASREEAADAAARIGFPVVLKIVSPDVVHKSDAGGVVLNVDSPDAAARGLRRDRRERARARPGRPDRRGCSSRPRPGPGSS